jgi:hypothetical protein
MRLKAALSRGIPVAVTCGRPAETSSILTIESRRQRERWEDLHNHGIPGEQRHPHVRQAGTKTLRMNILPKRFFRRSAKTKFRVLLGVSA